MGSSYRDQIIKLSLTFFIIITRNGSLIASVFFGSAGHWIKVVLTFVPIISRTDDWISGSVILFMWPFLTKIIRRYWIEVISVALKKRYSRIIHESYLSCPKFEVVYSYKYIGQTVGNVNNMNTMSKLKWLQLPLPDWIQDRQKPRLVSVAKHVLPMVSQSTSRKMVKLPENLFVSSENCDEMQALDV
jgi:hypothetical protein